MKTYALNENREIMYRIRVMSPSNNFCIFLYFFFWHPFVYLEFFAIYQPVPIKHLDKHAAQ